MPFKSRSLFCAINLIILSDFVQAEINYNDQDVQNVSTIISNDPNNPVTITTTTPIIMDGQGADTVLAAQRDSTLTLNNDANFTTSNAYYAIKADGGHVALNGKGNITIEIPSNIQSDGNHSSSAGIYVTNGGSITSNGGKKITIHTDSQNNFNKFAILASDNSSLTFNDLVEVQSINSGYNSIHIGSNPKDTSSVEFNNGLLGRTNKDFLIESQGVSKFTVNGGATLTKENQTEGYGNGIIKSIDNSEITINGVSHLNGSVYAENNSIINLNLENGSIFNGGAYALNKISNDILEQPKINIKLQGENSEWNIEEHSIVSSLILDNSKINFTGIDENNTTELVIGDLSGTGTFNMRTNIAASTADGLYSDHIFIKGNATGDYKINIANQGNSSTTGKERVTLINNTGSGDAQFGLTHLVEAGGYKYALRKTADTSDPTNPNATNWELYGLANNTNPGGATSASSKTSTAEASINFLNAAYLMNYIDTQTLFQRMGDLKATDGQEGNFWMRGFAGKLNSFNSHQLHGFDMNYNGYQLGIDKLLPMSHGNLYLGTMIGFTRGNPNYKEGDGTTKDYNAGLYGTYIDNSGFYLDAVAKYMYMRNQFSVTDTAGNKVNGTGKNKGYSVSLEAGKKFAISNSGFYIEPQTQITYSKMGSSTTHASNGLQVKLNGYDSTLARAGAALGYQINNAETPVDIYLKTGYVKEFAGNTSYKLNQNKEKYNFRGGWVDSALGINAQFNKRHNIYGEISYSNGDRFDKQQINLGYRYQF